MTECRDPLYELYTPTFGSGWFVVGLLEAGFSYELSNSVYNPRPNPNPQLQH